MTLFNVTQEHIDRGLRGDCADCPLAVCMTEALGEAIMVDGTMAWPRDREEFLSLDLPKVCGEFVDRFDCYGQVGVEPFTFEVDTRFWDEEM
jgi:hypothetical protein